MTYETLIEKLRIELSDLGFTDKFIVGEKFSGDGSTKKFQLAHGNIKDGSYTVLIGGAEKTETTDYTIDKDTGLVTFTSAPASGTENIEVRYKYVRIRDDGYIEIINDGIDHFRWKFWKEDIDSSTFKTVKDQYEYDLSSLTSLLYLIQAWYKTTSASSDWSSVKSVTNWKYFPRQKKLYVNPPFEANNYPLKLLYLRSFTKGTATSDDVDIPSEWILPYKYYTYARFYERLIPEKIHETAMVTTQPSFTPAQVVYNIAEMYYRKAEEVANKLAPKLPPLPIKQQIDGIEF